MCSKHLPVSARLSPVHIKSDTSHSGWAWEKAVLEGITTCARGGQDYFCIRVYECYQENSAAHRTVGTASASDNKLDTVMLFDLQKAF